jgi:hypothetical protein
MMYRTSLVLLIVALDEFNFGWHEAVPNYNDFGSFWQEPDSVWQGEKAVDQRNEWVS